VLPSKTWNSCVALLAAAIVCAAPAASPQLDRVSPAGVQRGTQADLVLSGARLADAAEILFYQPGIAVLSLTAEAGAVRARVEVAADCPLGEHQLRVRTATGISELRTLFVGALPTVAEAEPNSEFEAPQAVALGVTVAGVVTSEDVDYYVVDAAAGQRISAEVEAMRLGRAMFDPYVAILDARRFELAAADDTALLLQDAWASIVAPADGRYYVQVRETSYGGGDGFEYRLHVGSFPRPAGLFPTGAAPGQTIAVSPIGVAPASEPASLSVPADAGGWLPYFAIDAGGVAPSPNLLRISTAPAQVEGAAAASAPADPPRPPIAFDGVLAQPGETDEWKFTASKGQALVVQVFARRLRSPLDAVIDVLGVEGQVGASNDDALGPDSLIQFTTQNDGVYTARVRDHRGRGGEAFVYRVEIDAPQPALSLAIERINSRAPQYVQAVAVPRGNRFGMLVRADRQNVGGEVRVAAADLPAGIVLDAPPIPDGVQHVPVVFEAAADAGLAGALCPLTGTIERGEAPALVGALDQSVPLVLAPPNETVYYETRADRLAVAVTEAAPVSVRVVQPAAPIVQNGVTELRVLVDRAEGFAGDVELRMLWNPPGISSNATVKAPAGQTEVRFPLGAAGNAAVRKWKTAIVARFDAGDGERWVCTPLFELDVAAPFAGGAIQLAAVERGQAGQLLCTLEQKRAFEGQATLRLLGLPPKVQAPEKQVTAADTEVVFEIATEADAPLGTHKSLLCELLVTQNGEPVIHRFAHGGVLRIDAPKPPEVAAAPPPPEPAPAPAAAEAPPPPPRPLSRLEQLRQAAAERAAKEGGSE